MKPAVNAGKHANPATSAGKHVTDGHASRRKVGKNRKPAASAGEHAKRRPERENIPNGDQRGKTYNQ